MPGVAGVADSRRSADANSHGPTVLHVPSRWPPRDVAILDWRRLNGDADRAGDSDQQ